MRKLIITVTKTIRDNENNTKYGLMDLNSHGITVCK